MPRETVHNNPSQLSFVCEPGAIKIVALAEVEGGVEAGADGMPRLPRFEMLAYTGGPMRIGGWPDAGRTKRFPREFGNAFGFIRAWFTIIDQKKVEMSA